MRICALFVVVAAFEGQNYLEKAVFAVIYVHSNL